MCRHLYIYILYVYAYVYIYIYIYIFYTKFRPEVSGLAGLPVTSKAHLDCPVGLPAWPAGPVWASVLLAWASVLPFLAFRTPVGRQLDANWTPIGRQVGAKWTPSERQVGLPKRLPVSTYVLRTPKQLPSPTELLAISTYVAV